MPKDTLYGLTQADLRLVQQAVRFFKDNATMFRTYRRIRGQQPGGGQGLRHAYCKTSAPIGNTIVCYLDTDITGQEVTVHCHLFSETLLINCVPLLTVGLAIPVYKVADTWFCAWWFNKIQVCG